MFFRLDFPNRLSRGVIGQKFWSEFFDLDRGENHGTNPYGVEKVVKMARKCMKNRGFGIFGSEGLIRPYKAYWKKSKMAGARPNIN